MNNTMKLLALVSTAVISINCFATESTLPHEETESITINHDLKIIAAKDHQENADLAYSITISYPQLEGVMTPAAQQFNQAVASAVKQSTEQFINYVKADHAHMQTLPESVRTNSLAIDYDVDVVTPEKDPIISVRLNIEGMQAGRAHPYHQHRVINFALNKGIILTLDDVFKPGSNYLKTIASYCNKKLNSSLTDKWMITEGTKPLPKNFINWNMESDGILITFDEYQVAPYVNGPQEVEIPFSALKSNLAENTPIVPCIKGAFGCIAEG